MKTSVVAINLENPEDNDHFYTWPESAIELEDGTKQIDLVAISVAITDIDDYTDNRYDAVVSASKREVIVKMTKQPKHHYNSASREETSYNIKGHKLGAKTMKEHILNFRDESVCKKIHIELPYEVTTEYFNDKVSTDLRPIKWLNGEKAFPLELHKDLAYGYFGRGTLPKYSAVWRLGIKDTLQDLKPTNIDCIVDRFAEISTDAAGEKRVVDEFADYKGASNSGW
jgi:hypothetical protein